MGTKVISIDPRLTWWGARAEYWLQIRPGTDAALGCAWLNVIIEEELYDARLRRRPGAPASRSLADVRQGHDAGMGRGDLRPRRRRHPCVRAPVRRRQAGRHPVGPGLRPAAFRHGAVPGGMRPHGPLRQRRRSGRQHPRAQRVRDQRRLRLGRASHAARVARARSSTTTSRSPSKAATSWRMRSSDGLLQAIEDGFPYPIKMMWIQSSNTLSCPSQDAPRVMKAMQNIPFIVNADPYVTPTSVASGRHRCLPVAMSAERNSAPARGGRPCRAMVKVADYYEAKSDEQIILELGRRLNPEVFGQWETDIDWLNWYLHDGTGSFSATTEATDQGGAKNSGKTLFTADWEELVKRPVHAGALLRRIQRHVPQGGQGHVPRGRQRGLRHAVGPFGTGPDALPVLGPVHHAVPHRAARRPPLHARAHGRSIRSSSRAGAARSSSSIPNTASCPRCASCIRSRACW